MAYALRYYKEITHADGTIIRLEIHKKDSTAGAIEIGAVVQGLSLQIQGQQGDIDTPIVKTSLSMTFADAQDLGNGKKNGFWEEFYTPDAVLWKVILKAKKAQETEFRTIWGGYVTPDSFSEDLVYRGSVSITARDNIGHMQDFPFDAEGDADGMISLYNLVESGWEKIHSPMMLEWRGMTDSTMWLECDGVSAMFTLMNVSMFEGMDWYKAIETALASYGVVMRYIGNNIVKMSSLRSMPYQGAENIEDLIHIEPTFVSGATRELIPAVKRIEESVGYDLVTAVSMPQVKVEDFTGSTGTYRCKIDGVGIDGQSFGTAEHDAPVWSINNAKGWSNIPSSTLFFNPHAYELGYFAQQRGLGDEMLRYMYIAANNVDNRVVSFSRNITCADMTIRIKFGLPCNLDIQNRFEQQRVFNLKKITFCISLTQNGIAQYYGKGGGWSASYQQITTEYDATMPSFDFEQFIGMGEFTGLAELNFSIIKIEYAQTSFVGNSSKYGLYACIQDLSFCIAESTSMLENNTVNTNYQEGNNVILTRDPELAPALNTTALPAFIKNGIFYRQGDVILPARKWSWGSGSEQQMAVWNHLQLLSYYAKPNNLISGTIVNADITRAKAIYMWHGAEHILVSGTYNFLNGHIESAMLREFARYEDMWSEVAGADLPDTEQDSRSNVEGGASSGGATSTYSSTTNVNIGSGGGGTGASYLNDLLDVDTTGVVAQSVLYYNGTSWVDMSLPTLLNPYLKADIAAQTYAKSSDLSALTTRVGANEGSIASLQSGKADKAELDNYLPLEGGTMNGHITLKDKVYIKQVSNGYAVLGYDGKQFIIAAPNRATTIRSNGTLKHNSSIILDASNYSDYTYSQDYLNAEFAKYLLLESENQTIKGNIRIEGNLIVTGDTATGGEGGSVPVGITGILVDGMTYRDKNADGVIDITDAFEGLQEKIDLTNYYTRVEVDAQVSAINNEVSGKASQSDLDGVSGRVATLENAGYATQTYVNTAIGNLNIGQYATKTYVGEQITALNISQYLKSATAESTYAKITSLTAVDNRLKGIEAYFATSEDAGTQIDKWNEIVAFLDATEGTTLAGILEAYTLKSVYEAFVSTTNTALADRYTKAQIDGKVTTINNALADRYTKTQVDGIVTTINQSIASVDNKYASTKTWADTLASLIVNENGNIRIKTNLIVNGDTASGGGSGETAIGITGILLNGTTYRDDNSDGIIDLGTITSGLTSVNWSDVQGRPTALSQFNNDLGLGTLAYKNGLTASDVGALSTAGGEIRGAGGNLFTINRSDGNPTIVFAYNNSVMGRLGFDTSGNPIAQIGGTYYNILTSAGGTISGRFTIGDYIQFNRLGDGKTYLLGQPYGVDDPALSFYDGGAWRKLYHTGNFNPADYLPLSGGTMTGGLDYIVPSNKYWANGLTYYDTANNTVAQIGAYSSNSGVVDRIYLGFHNGAWNGVNALLITKDTISYNNNTLIHSGNIGSYKSGDSDKLGGQVPSYYVGQHRDVSQTLDASTVTQNHITHGSKWSNAPTSDIMSLLDMTYSNDWRTQIIARPYNQHIWARFYYNGTTWSDWKTIAFTDSNVASAQALKTSGGVTFAEFAESTVYIGGGTYQNHNTSILGKTVRLYSGNASLGLLLNSSGNVTIGSSDLASTTTKLYVDGGIRFAPRTIWGQSFDGTGNVWGNLNLHSDKLIFNSDASNYFISCQGTSLATYNMYGGHSFCTLGGAQRMLINSSGNVGIGTTDPVYKLDVNGDVGISSTNGSIEIDNGRVIGNATLTMQAIGTTHARIQTSHFGVAYTCPLYINPSGGNVLIGTTDDSGYKLDVNGSVRTTSEFFMNHGKAIRMTTNSGKQLNALFTSSENLHLGYDATYVVIGGRIAANGGADINGTLTAGATTINGDVRINGNLIVTGDTASGGSAGTTTGGGTVLTLTSDIPTGNVTQERLNGIGLTDDVINDLINGKYHHLIINYNGYHELYNISAYKSANARHLIFQFGSNMAGAGDSYSLYQYNGGTWTIEYSEV